MLVVELLYASFVCATFINIDQTRLSISTDSFIKETQRCLGAAFSGEKGVNGISVL